MKNEQWEEVVSGLMRHTARIDVAEDMTPEGQFKEHVRDFINARVVDDSFDSLLRGVPYKDDTGVHFRMKDLITYLKAQRFTELKPNTMSSILKNDMKAQNNAKSIKGSFTRYISLPEFAVPTAQLDVPDRPVPF